MGNEEMTWAMRRGHEEGTWRGHGQWGGGDMGRGN